jgi:hypothetical protein
MSKFISNDETKKTDSKKVIFDYYNTKIYFNQYGQTPDNGGYVDITFSTPANVVNPNIIYISQGPTLKYKSSKLFVYKKTHFIDDLVFDGEIVIENTPITNNNNEKIYVCIPLKTNASIQSTDIDEMISTADVINPSKISMDINLNDKINKKNPYFYYENGANKIVVLNTAVEVNTSFENFKTCDLFPNYDEKYLILQNITDGFANVVEGFPEGATTIQTCVPIDETGKDESNGLIVNYLNGSITSQNKTIDILFSIIIFIIVSLISLFISPHIYKKIFHDILEDTKLHKSIIFCFFYLVFAGALFGGGFVYDYYSLIVGIILLTFFTMSFVFIYNRAKSDPGYLNGAVFDWNKLGDTWITAFKTIWPSLANIRYLFSVKNFNSNSIVTFIGLVISTLLLVGILHYSSPMNKKIKNKKNKKYMGKKIKNNEFDTDPNTGYMKYVYIMLGIFGYVYSLCVVGPFYYALNTDTPIP